MSNTHEQHNPTVAISESEPTEDTKASSRLGLLSGGLPFGEFKWLSESKLAEDTPVYDGLLFEPFARPFQHADYVAQADTWESTKVETLQPFARHLSQAPYSHHDESQAAEEFSLVRYDEDSQTTIFPPGIVAGKGWCRRGTTGSLFTVRTDTVRD